MRTRYKFSHRGVDGFYYWYSTTPVTGDSRSERIRCQADWFWSTAVRAETAA